MAVECLLSYNPAEALNPKRLNPNAKVLNAKPPLREAGGASDETLRL